MRIALAPAEYLKLRDRVFVFQHGRCADCGEPLGINEIDLHHNAGRGIGGGFRNDFDTRGVCRKCHKVADRNKRSKWIVIETNESKTA